MYAQDNKERIGKVTIENYFQGKYTRLRFTYPKGKRQVITIGLTSPQNKQVAIVKANEVNADITGDQVTGLYTCFDKTLIKYDPSRQSVSLEVVKEVQEPTVKDLWELYKEKQKHIAAKTTQQNTWVEIDRMISNLPLSALLLKNVNSLGHECLKIRALSSVDRYFGSLQAAIRLHENYKKIELKQQLPRTKKKPIEWFEPYEVAKILQAFKDNRFKPNNSQYNHSFYYPYASFCAYTGCRPEEAIALTWNDLHWNGTKTQCQVSINKAFSKGILKETKNGVSRIIPLSSKLISLLIEWEKDCPKSPDNLVFPSVESGYINIRNYRKRYWKVILDGLVQQKEIKKYLKPYCLRHSFVTNLHYNHGVSFAVIAGLIGDLIKTVIDKYTGLKPFDAGKMPDIY